MNITTLAEHEPSLYIEFTSHETVPGSDGQRQWRQGLQLCVRAIQGQGPILQALILNAEYGRKYSLCCLFSKCGGNKD